MLTDDSTPSLHLNAVREAQRGLLKALAELHYLIENGERQDRCLAGLHWIADYGAALADLAARPQAHLTATMHCTECGTYDRELNLTDGILFLPKCDHCARSVVVEALTPSEGPS